MSPKRPPEMWHVTAHALDRYMERFCPDVPAEDAREELIERLRVSVLVGARMGRDGEPGDLLGDPRIAQAMFLCRTDASGVRVCVTVLDSEVHRHHGGRAKGRVGRDVRPRRGGASRRRRE